MTAISRRRFAAKAASALMAAVLAVGMCLPALPLAQGSGVGAQQAQAAQGELSGQAWCVCTNPGYTNADGNRFDVTMPDGQVIEGHCTNYGWAYPADGWYSFTATWDGSGYEVVLDTYGASPHPSCLLAGPCQTVGRAKWYPTGGIDLIKASANPSLSDGNPCYSLAGATYGVYSDSGCTDRVAGLTTDASGYAYADGIMAGTYWVKEETASAGYALDRASYQVDVSYGQTARVNGGTVLEYPCGDPIGMLVGKYDGSRTYNGEGNLPQGSASLAGAQYTVRYYDGQYDEAGLPGAPTREWVFQTNANGFAYYSDEYKISGPSLYYNTSGRPVIPVGTFTIQETKAPAGYVLSSELHLYNIRDNQLDDIVRDYNALEHPESVQRGDYRLTKIAELKPETSEHPGFDGNVAVEGARFEMYNSTDGTVVSPEDGREVEPGGLVCTIVSDENGYASTRNDKANGWSVPDGWTGALAYGAYWVKEKIPQDVADRYMREYGVKIATEYDWTAVISADGQYAPAIAVTNKPAQTWLKIEKRDAETGKAIPLAAAFKIFDSEGRAVTYSGFELGGETKDTWETGPDGSVGLPMKLAGGSYTLVEQSAPEGYVLDADPIPFTVDAYGSVDSPLIVTAADVPQKGVIEVSKTDAADGAAVPGAVYEVRAAADVATPEGTVRAKAGDVVDTLVTGEDGKASSKQLYLGSYEVKEVSVPEGWALDDETHRVEIAYAGQEVAVASAHLGVTDQPTTVSIEKKSSLDGAALPGAEFTLSPAGSSSDSWDAQAIPGAMASALGADVAVEDLDELVSFCDPKHQHRDESVWFEASVDGVPGRYKAQLDDGGALLVFGSDDSLICVIDPKASYEDPSRVRTAVVGADGTAVFDHIGRGSWEVRETKPADGCLVRSDKVLSFTVGDDGLIRAEGSEPAAKACFEVENTPVTARTSASGKESGQSEEQVGGRAAVVDRFDYTGLPADGRVFTLKTELRFADTGEPVMDGDAPASATTEFAPEAMNGSVDAEISFPSDGLAGRKVVVFERLYMGRELVASHEDLSDEGQSVKLIDIGTKARVSQTGGSMGCLDESMEVVDAVSFKGLTPWKPYTLKSALVGDDGNMLVVDQKAAAGELTFTPESPDGEVEVKIAVDSTGLAGKRLTAFERLFPADGDEPIAKHEDPSDEGQTVRVPSIGTTATDAQSGTHQAMATESVSISDKVQHEGLASGAAMRLEGKLVFADTGEPVQNDGGEVSATVEFAPEQADGSVTLELPAFNARELAGRKVVVFERLYDQASGSLVAAHEDPSDEGQTVAIGDVPENTTTTFFEKTGDWIASHWMLIAGLALAAAGLALGGRRLLANGGGR